MSLESKHFVASPTDVEAITKAVLDAQSTGSSGRTNYFIAFIATLQDRLGVPPRKRQAAIGKVSPEEKARHLEMLEAVNEEFSKSVNKAAREMLGSSYTPQKLQTATNFARSAASTVRSWVRAGNDITTLVAVKATKKQLAVAAKRPRPPSFVVLTKQANRWSERLVKTVTVLAAADQTVARETLETVITKLRDTLDELGVSSRPRSARTTSRQESRARLS